MTPESSPPESAPTESQPEEGTKSADANRPDPRTSVSRAPGVWDASDDTQSVARASAPDGTETDGATKAAKPPTNDSEVRQSDPLPSAADTAGASSHGTVGAEHPDRNGASQTNPASNELTANSGGESKTPLGGGTTEAMQSQDLPDSDVLELDADSVRPPPPRSQRPRTAKDSKAAPLGVTATLPPPSWPPRIVGDLMTRKLITVQNDEEIGDLEECMRRFRFHHLPVVTSEMKLVGLITRTDLLHAQLGRKPDGTSMPPVDNHTKAREIMRRNVVVARLDYSVTTACKVMIENTLACLPIVQENGTLIGILTQTDFTRLALSLLEPRVT